MRHIDELHRAALDSRWLGAVNRVRRMQRIVAPAWVVDVLSTSTLLTEGLIAMCPGIGYNQQVKRATNTDNKHHYSPKREATRPNFEDAPIARLRVKLSADNAHLATMSSPTRCAVL